MIKLGTIDESHLPRMLKWRNDESIFKWCRQNDFLTEANHLSWFKKISQDDSIKMYSVNTESSFIGVAGLTSIDLINQRAEFSLYIGPEYQGLGYGKEALIELLKLGFTRYPLNTIWGEVFEGNHALNIFKQIGFIFEGTRRDFYYRNGKFIDANLVSIKKDEFFK